MSSDVPDQNTDMPATSVPRADSGDQTERAAFPVVGIGASAGGLAAFEAFFSSMPFDTASPMAFVLVQHLAPDHKSILSELIGRYTQMKVFEVEDGMIVRPNCAYIIPPGHDMAFFNGSLQLLEQSTVRGQRLPIDFLFRSLADDQKERSIGIVLSGTASDGTLGVRAIKGEGGMVMVQSPESAEYDGMPRSALATGLVDYELSPQEMPEALIEYVSRALGNASPCDAGPTPGMEKHLKKVLTLLRTEAGHDFSLYKPNSIIRRIERRMAIQQIDSMEYYVKYLQQTPDETNALFKDLLIGVTRFFRDSEAFAALEQTVVPELFEGARNGGAIRVWSPGCSTGEEAYSVAILLQEAMERSGLSLSLQVFATDIDSEAIAVARSGVFPSSVVADISQERLARFFTADSSGSDSSPHSYRINKNIRDILIFSEQNVIKDPPLSRMDLITCRNLLIYLSGDLHRKLIPMFHYSLNPGGMLFLGLSESVGEFTDLFATLDAKAKLYRRNDRPIGGTRRVPSSFLPSMESTRPRLTAERSPQPKAPLRELAEQTLLQHLAPASALVERNGDIVYLHGRTGKYLEPATGDVGTYNILSMAREGLQYELNTALGEAVQTNDTVRRRGLSVKTNEHFAPVNLSICPAAKRPDAPDSKPLYLVVLEDGVMPKDRQPADADHGNSAGSARGSDNDALVVSLRKELQAKDEFLRAANDELETTNADLRSSVEEMQSMNEELQSTNEELETSKEELQSVNEELAAVNVELQTKVADLSRSNNDMNNLLAGTGIATVFLDHQLRILRFTPTASELINLIPGDEGRPVAHILSNLFGYDRMVEDVRDVLDTLVPKKREVQTTEGKWFNMGILPYRTLDNVIEGVVINFVDITDRKKADDEIRKQLSEKETLLQEIHHRIKNNITSVSILLSTQARSTRNPEALSILQDAIGRLNSMSVLYENLLIRQEYEASSVKSYVEGLVDSLVAAVPPPEGVAIEKRISDFALVPARLFPLGIIINELLTNVIKYAFVGKDSGVVTISLTETGSRATLTVEDNGIGLPENYQTGETKGFGHTLVNMLTDQLGGRFFIESDDGTTSVLEFDL